MTQCSQDEFIVNAAMNSPLHPLLERLQEHLGSSLEPGVTLHLETKSKMQDEPLALNVLLGQDGSLAVDIEVTPGDVTSYKRMAGGSLDGGSSIASINGRNVRHIRWVLDNWSGAAGVTMEDSTFTLPANKPVHTGYLITEGGWIAGPHHSSQFWVEEGVIRGPFHSREYTIRDDRIYGPDCNGEFFLDDGHIFGPSDVLPWLKDAPS